MSKFTVGQRVRYKDEPLLIHSDYNNGFYTCEPWFDTDGEYLQLYKGADLMSEEDYRAVYGELYGTDGHMADYTAFVKGKLLQVDEPIDYCLAGLVEEVGEVSRLVRKMHQGKKEVTREEMCDELGDVLYYYTALMAISGLTYEQVIDYNKQKLNKKHGI